MKKNGQTKCILFFAESVTLAHIVRSLVLANSLNSNRNKIFFATGKKYAYLVKKSGHNLYQIPSISPTLFLERVAKGKPIYTRKELKLSIETDLELFSKLSPDVVVGDFRISLGISTRLAKIRYISLANAYWSPYSTLSLPLPEHPIINFCGEKIAKILFKMLSSFILKHHCTPFNSLCKTYGIPKLKTLNEIYTWGNWTLYLDLPILYPILNAPNNHFYLGPVTGTPSTSFPNWWNNIPQNKPIVYVNIGSTGDIQFINTLIDTLGEMSITILIATAGRFNPEKIPDNIFLDEYLPGVEAAKISSLIICNGGSGTTYQAFLSGKPVLGIPANADQFLNMEAIAQHGSGILIRAGKVTKKNLRQNIETIIKNSSFKQKAKELQQEMSHYNSSKQFSSFIDSFEIQ